MTRLEGVRPVLHRAFCLGEWPDEVLGALAGRAGEDLTLLREEGVLV